MEKPIKIILNSPGEIEKLVFSRLVNNNILEVVDVLFWEMEYYESLNPQLRVIDPVPMWTLVSKGLIGDFSDIDLSLFSADVENNLLWCESQAFEMMERMDPSRSQTYQQRKSLYIYLVCYWIGKLERLKPDYFYSRAAPHEVIDFILFAICKVAGIKVVLTKYTALPGVKIFADDYRDIGKILVPPERLTNFCRKEELKKNICDKIDRSIRPPGYVTQQKFLIDDGFYSTLKVNYKERLFYDGGFIFLQLVSLLRLFKSTILNRDFPYPIIEKIYRRSSSYLSLAFFKRIAAEYSKYTEEKMPEKFVYFLLHTQPESTTSPLGGRYVNMTLAIAMISKALPAGWVLCVKEHPSQFLQNHYFYIGRDRHYYQRLASMPKVQLIPTNVDHNHWLDRAQCVAAITGTVGWESVLKRKPVMVFGEAWYQDAPGVTRVGSAEDCEKFFDEIDMLSDAATEEAILDYVDLLACQSANLYFDSEEAGWHGESFDFAYNADRLELILENIIGS